MADLSRKLIHVIKEKTPGGTAPVDFFIDILPMKKEAAYRRLRNEIPLTLSEAVQISENLNVSLDELLKFKEEDTCKMRMMKMQGESLFSGYEKTMQLLVDSLKIMDSESEVTLYSAANRLPFIFLFNFPTLSRFRLYVSNYQLRKEIMPMKMSDFIVPNYIRELEKMYVSLVRKYPAHLVWTKDLFASVAIEIQYFSEINMLSKDEINKLKDELCALLDMVEHVLVSGKMDNGVPFFAYLSSINIDNSYIYAKSTNFEACSINIFGINFFSSLESEFCKNVDNWIQSLAKYSILMSQSGIIERIDFIKRQRNFLDTIN